MSRSELAFLARALEVPRVLEVAPRLAERAREQGWGHEEYLARVLAEEVSAREAHDGDVGCARPASPR